MEYKRLGDIATYINGYAFKPEQWSNKGKPIIRIQNLNNKEAECNHFDGEIDEKYLIKQGDVLISWSASIGVYEWDLEDAYLNQHIFKVVFDKEKIDKRYFKFMVNIALNKAVQYMHGSTMKHITKKYFDNILIPVPSLDKQNKIARILDKAQSLIDKKRERIELLDELVKSRFIEMFSKQNFDLVKAKEVCEYITKGSTPPKNEISEVKENNNDIPYLKVYNLSFNGKLLFKQKEQYIKEETHNKLLSRSKVVPGDVLMNIVGPPLGKFAIVPEDFKEWNINQAIAIFRATERINNIYLLHSLKQDKILKPFIESAVGIRQQNISLLQCRNIEIPLPPIELQNEFAEFVKQTDSIRSKMETSLSELEDNFNSLMQKAFKGELF